MNDLDPPARKKPVQPPASNDQVLAELAAVRVQVFGLGRLCSDLREELHKTNAMLVSACEAIEYLGGRYRLIRMKTIQAPDGARRQGLEFAGEELIEGSSPSSLPPPVPNRFFPPSLTDFR